MKRIELRFSSAPARTTYVLVGRGLFAGLVRDLIVKNLYSATGIQGTTVLKDRIAEELGYEGGAKGMRTALRSQLEQQADELARNQARANLLQALIDANSFEVPGGMIDQQLQIRMQGKVGPKISLGDSLGASELAVRRVSTGGWELQLRRLFFF